MATPFHAVQRWFARARHAVVRMLGLGRRAGEDRRMAEEMEFHIHMATVRNVRAGMTPPDARRAARSAFGGVTRWQQEARAELRASRFESLVLDARYAVRTLRRNLSYNAVAIGILAVGIGVSTTLFRIADTLLLQAPAVADAANVVELFNADTRATSALERDTPLSYPEYEYFRRGHGPAEAVRDLAAFDGDPAFLSWKRASGGELVRAQFVSDNFFSVLGVAPALGRLFTERDSAGGDQVAVVSEAFWRTRLGQPRDFTGLTLTVNGEAFAIIGVAPRRFTGLVAALAPEVWLPVRTVGRVKHDPGLLASRNTSWLIAVGRVPPSARAQAEADLSAQLQDFAAGDRDLAPLSIAMFRAAMVPGPFRGYVAAFIGVLQVLVTLMLVIACTNVVNIVLALVMSRRAELAVRSSLGASGARITQQLVTEGLALAALAGLAGLVVAWIAAPLLTRLIPSTLPVELRLPFDWRVPAYAASLTLAAGALLGMVMARRATRDLMASMKENWRGMRSGLRRSLVIVQFAASVVLLAAGALCWKSLARARAVDPGFDPTHRAFVKLDVKALDYSPEAGRAFYRRLTDRLAVAPGIVSVSTASYLPLETTYLSGLVSALEPSGNTGAPSTVQFIDVGSGYFATMGTRLLRGREFRADDGMQSSRVVVINDALARKFWPGENPVGKVVRAGSGSEETPYEVIGVVATGKYRTLGEAPRPVLFRALAQQYVPRQVVIVHSSAPTEETLRTMRREVADIEPNLAVIQANSLADQTAIAMFPVRVSGILCTVVGVIGLAFALTGLAALLAYSVVTRTREIGIRMALGARRLDVVREVVGEGARLAGAGTVVGAAIAFAIARYLSSVLFGVSATDPATFAAVIGGMAVCALVASLLVARRAAAIDPLVAIRSE